LLPYANSNVKVSDCRINVNATLNLQTTMDKFGAIGAIDFASNVILDAIECNMSITTAWSSWNGYNTTYIGGLVGLIN